MGFGLWVVDLRFWTLDVWLLDSTFRVVDLSCWTFDFWSLDSTFRITLDSGLDTLELGF